MLILVIFLQYGRLTIATANKVTTVKNSKSKMFILLSIKFVTKKFLTIQ